MTRVEQLLLAGSALLSVAVFLLGFLAGRLTTETRMVRQLEQAELDRLSRLAEQQRIELDTRRPSPWPVDQQATREIPRQRWRDLDR